jgi:IS5 family transposase
MGKAPFYLTPPSKGREHIYVRELRTLADALHEHPQLYAMVQAELDQGAHAAQTEPSMSAEQVLRCLVLRQMKGYGYPELAYRLNDSMSTRGFCLVAPAAAGPTEQTLRQHLEWVSVPVWANIHQVLMERCPRIWKKKYEPRLRD